MGHANLLLALRPEVRDTVCLMCACKPVAGSEAKVRDTVCLMCACKPVAGSEARGQGYCVFNVWGMQTCCWL